MILAHAKTWHYRYFRLYDDESILEETVLLSNRFKIYLGDG